MQLHVSFVYGEECSYTCIIYIGRSMQLHVSHMCMEQSRYTPVSVMQLRICYLHGGRISCHCHAVNHTLSLQGDGYTCACGRMSKKNYHRVSKLSFMPTIFEKLVANRLHEYIIHNTYQDDL